MSTIKKIPISQLKIGMYIHEMDISWMQSPFRLHRRKVENQKEIISLQKAGARIVSIDTTEGGDIEVDDVALVVHDDKQIFGLIKPSVSLDKELIEAKLIKNKIQKLVRTLNSNVTSGDAIDIKDVSPIIDETIKSLKRNDQALLTLLHIHRQDIRLDSHAFGVFSLLLLLALKTRCSSKEIETLGMAAILHDCGWARLPINLFAKGKPYTTSEKKLAEQHIAIVNNTFKVSKGIPKDVIQLIIQHHELPNGKGYPQQHTAEQLHPLHALLQVVDRYDESIHGLEDLPGMLPANTLKSLYKMSKNGWFPENLVTELVRLLGIYPISSVVKLTSDEIAQVIEINRKLPLLPKVSILGDNRQQALESPVLVNLSNDSQNRLIKEVLEPSALLAL